MKANPMKLIERASQALAEFEFKQAADLYQEALKLSPNNGAAMMGMALLLNLTGNHKEALTILQGLWNALQQSPPEAQAKVHNYTRAEILGQIGVALQALQQNAQALQFFQAAHQVYGAPALAERIRKLSGVKTDGTPFGKALAKALKLRAEMKLDKAVEAFKEALQLNPDSDVAQHGLGDVYRLQGNLQQAMPLLQQAIIMQPAIAEYHNTLGMLVQQRGDLNKALIFYKRALEIDQNYASAYCNLGVALKNLNRLDEAASAYRKALGINPGMAEAHNNLGNLLRITGDLDGAKAALKQALKLRPQYPDAERNLASVLEMEKNAAAKATPKKGVQPRQQAKPKVATKKQAPAKKAPAKPAVKPAAGKAAVKQKPDKAAPQRKAAPAKLKPKAKATKR